METKDILQKIIEEEKIDYISLGVNSFTLKLGDIENTTTASGFKYWLLETYIEIPYTFSSREFKLHRGVVNEFETTRVPHYRYSGFVHYNGEEFCYGQAGIERICATIRDSGLDSDTLSMLIVKLRVYLSVSSHNTTGNYRRMRPIENDSRTTRELVGVVEKNGLRYPSQIRITTTTSVETVDYTKPYIEVLKEVNDKAFAFKDTIIIPKIVSHHTNKSVEQVSHMQRIDMKAIDDYIRRQLLKKELNEIDRITPITFQNFLHKLPDLPRGMDGVSYL